MNKVQRNARIGLAVEGNNGSGESVDVTYEQPRDGADAERESHGEDEHAEQRDPVEVRGGGPLVHVLVVGEGAEARQRHGHERGAGEQQRQSSGGVDEQPRQQRRQQLHQRHGHGAPVRVHAAQRLSEDGHRVEVEGVGSGEALEQHQPASGQHRPQQTRRGGQVRAPAPGKKKKKRRKKWLQLERIGYLTL